jgi:hypothetical protein
MKKIEEIDNNFKAAKVNDIDVNYYNVINKPFSLEGFPWGNPAEGKFYRLPDYL